MKTKIISIYNNKGGVGKTTTTKRFAKEKIKQGKKVLIIDMDPQGNITSQFVQQDINNSTYELLTEDISISDCVIKGEIDIIPSNLKLLEANNKILMEGMNKNPNTRLKNKLKNLENQYDYILLDCPPTMDSLVSNALTITSDVIIPIGCDNYSIQGIEMLIKKINQIKEEFNPSLKISGIFLNRYKNSKIHNELLEKLSEALPNLMCKTAIGDYAIINKDTFETAEEIDKHKVADQFKSVFKEMGV